LRRVFQVEIEEMGERWEEEKWIAREVGDDDLLAAMVEIEG